MKDEDKTREQLISELQSARERVAEVDKPALERRLAVERIRAEAMAMRSSDDLLKHGRKNREIAGVVRFLGNDDVPRLSKLQRLFQQFYRAHPSLSSSPWSVACIHREAGL